MKKETKIPVGGVMQPGVRELMMLREATFRFGYLHELQNLQLQIWPSVFLHKDARVSEIRYGHEERLLEVELKSIEKNRLNLKEGAVNFDKAAKFLLGPDVRVRVMLEGQAIYDGEPRDTAWLSSTSQPTKKPSSKSGKKTAKSRRSRRR